MKNETAASPEMTPETLWQLMREATLTAPAWGSVTTQGKERARLALETLRAAITSEEVRRWKGAAVSAKFQRDVIIDEGVDKMGEIEALKAEAANHRAENEALKIEVARKMAGLSDICRMVEYGPIWQRASDAMRRL